jgi:3-mercaptopyruvate sulfurtransferase SseA
MAAARAWWPLRGPGHRPVRVLHGGYPAWVAAGLPVEAGLERATTTNDDVWYKPYDAADEAVARRHMEEYLAWEVALLAQVDRDELVTFRTFPPA